MRKAEIQINGKRAGILEESERAKKYIFSYDEDYQGRPVSLTLPLQKREFVFDCFPSFFDGLLPEGPQLEGLLKQKKIDRHDLFSQLLAVGVDTIGAITIREI
jgi:serine/threonine-protein kinase HipA